MSSRRSRLAKGFDSLTLNPAPRLRKAARDSSARPAANVTGWNNVSEALSKATAEVRQMLSKGRTSS